MLTVMQFTGCGDPMFGGSADDRALYRVGTASAFCHRFMRCADAQRAAHFGEPVELAKFHTAQEALDAAEHALERVPGAPLGVM